MTTIEQICNALVDLILAGVVLRIAFLAFRMIVEQEGDLKQIRNQIIVAVLAATVLLLKTTILFYYQ